MAYKGTMHFAVCAVRVDAAGNILQEWHSKLGAGDVANGIEATVQNIGGQDLLAHIQSITAAAQQNAAAAQRDAAAAAKSAEKAAENAEKAAENAKAAGDTATKIINDGIAGKLTEMQNIQTDVTTKKGAVDTAAATTTKARDDAQAAQKAAADSASEALASQNSAAALVEQAKNAATQAQGYAGAATFAIGYDADGLLTLYMDNGKS